MKYKMLVDASNQVALEKGKKIEKVLKADQSDNGLEYIFIIGGDGWFLKNSAPFMENKDVRIIFINAGTLGFYSWTNNIEEINIDELLNESNFETISLIRVCQGSTCHYAINDFVISSPYAINLTVDIDNKLLQKIKANGLLVATPMGSTARSKSLGGAILMPNLPVISITEIEPIHNKYYSSLGSSLVISNEDKIVIKADNYNGGCSLISDGQVISVGDKEIKIDIEQVRSKAKLMIKTDTKNWIHKLNTAFNNEN